jgi:hypothetical protein
VSETSEDSSGIPPQGARVRRAGGTAVECDVQRGRPSSFYGGYEIWNAVAREPMSLDYNSDRFECDLVPPKSVICFSVDLLPGGDGWPGDVEGVERATFGSDFPCPEGGTGLAWPARPGPLPEGEPPFACDYPAEVPYSLSRGAGVLG